MPPSNTTGIISAGKARQVTPGSSRSGTAGSTGKLRRRAIQLLTPAITAAISSPGMKPPRNRWPTDTSATRAYSTIGIDGGTMGPVHAVAAVMGEPMPHDLQPDLVRGEAFYRTNCTA